MGVDADNFVSKLAERDNDDRAYDVVEIMVWLATADQRVAAESGITRYLEEIRKVPMLEQPEENMLGQRGARARRPRGGAQARQQSSAPRRQDRHGLSRLRLADLRIDLGGQCRPHAGGQGLAAGQGVQGPPH